MLLLLAFRIPIDVLNPKPTLTLVPLEVHCTVSIVVC